MKILFFLTSFCFSAFCFSQTVQKDSTEKIIVDDKIYFPTELSTLPNYKGSQDSLANYLSNKFKDIKAPEKYIKSKSEFTIFVQCIIEKTGEISNADISRISRIEMNSNDVDYIKNTLMQMPYWNPGVLLDQPKRTLVSIPISFN